MIDCNAACGAAGNRLIVLDLRGVVMIARGLAIVVLAALAVAAPSAAAAAQRSTDPSCSDDRGVDRCSEEQQRRTRQLFGVRSIEEHGAAGDDVRRVFYVDGYGRDIVMIAFVRAPGRDPTAWIYHPEREGEARPEPFQAPVSQEAWKEVVEGSANFHRSFVGQRPAPTANSEEGEIVVCLHSWVYTIEAVDRPQLNSPPQIRRKTEDACEDGPGEAFAQQLDRIARSMFPHCAALDVEQYGNEAMALAACRILRGDRLAAAEVLNGAQAIADGGAPGRRPDLSPVRL
ncbi:hypothetical protein [Allosphingosinicella sp.]|uniref:hypothetical protein n=1 Tax=Allosphingosinicella sp. TaxID=2823234 RepID=UPI003D70B236